jgi:hypothetical protein
VASSCKSDASSSTVGEDADVQAEGPRYCAASSMIFTGYGFARQK